MKRPQLVSKGAFGRMIQEAQEAWQKKDFQKNIEILERAHRLDPANWAILMQLGRAHGLGYDYAKAERCFEQAIRVAPKKTDAMASAGIQSKDFRSPVLAERYLTRAAGQSDVAPETLIRLAELQERSRHTEEAARLIERALGLKPNFPPAILARARLERQAGQLDEAERLLVLLVRAADKESAVRGCYELGAVFDRQGRYDQAMAAFVQAKALLQPDAPPHVAALSRIRERLKSMRENLRPEMMSGWLNTSNQFSPPHRLALLCGNPRSGTTLLEQLLDSHPDIVSAEETDTFNDIAYVPLMHGNLDNAYLLAALESAPITDLQQARDRYFHTMELMFGEPVGARLLIDKNPSLTFLIAPFVRVFPEAKYLVALRDPRDVCLSCFMQPFYPLGSVNSAYLTLEATMDEYAALMETWRVVAPMMTGRYIEVRYENLVENLETESRRVLDFLGIEWDRRVLRFDEHARGKIVRSPTYAEVTKPVFKTAVGRWRNYEKYLAPHLDKLAPYVKAFRYE